MAGHDHAHHTGSPHPGRLSVALCITGVVFVLQLVGAWLTGSLALLFDSAHVLTDAAGLGMALLAARLAVRPASDRRTWGFARAEVLAATAQAAVLLAVGLVVLVEGVQRLINPSPIASTEMAVFGAVGLLGNILSLAVLFGARHANFNLRAAFLEVLSDALGSVAVIAAAVVIGLTGWLQADAVVALLIGTLILPRTFRLLLDTIRVLLESTPRGLELSTVREHILRVPHVLSVHDLHVSQIASGLPVLTAHVVVDDGCFTDGHVPRLLDQLQQCVAGHFQISIEHSTFQLEPASHAGHEHGVHT
ncbi:cation transporter [Paenarthrobacter sp. Z7-10]|uniref:cation diffusion facilitator family transporter n=1 Tax=Paenarthrobacter sp. Z7-10 TaxID=2787635 RepID=UPI0022A959B0|nr:cation diffusion facilitator family transporter [Paenarthrobacter sp. Z7-10]MCZ2401934.1 cation transporter [Paenarthrobacter sp. Z7-10]